jgi:hypothetical protein
LSLALAQLIWGVLVPSLLAAAVLAAAAIVLWRRGEGQEAQRGGFAAAAAVAIGPAVTQLMLLGAPPFPAVQAVQWIFWTGLLAALVGLTRLESVGLRWGSRLVLILIALGLLLRSLIAHQWAAAQTAQVLPLLALLMLLLWGGLDRMASATPCGPLVPAVALVIGTGAAICTGLSGSAVIGVLAGSLTATCGAALIAARAWLHWEFAGYLTTPFAVIAGSLLACSRFFSELPTSCGVLIALAPMAAELLASRFVRNASPWRAGLLRLAIVALLVAVAIGIAVLNFEPADPYGYA